MQETSQRGQAGIVLSGWFVLVCCFFCFGLFSEENLKVGQEACK